MELLPSELRATIPPLTAKDQEEDPLIWVKFLAPEHDWTWYVLAGSPQGDDYLMFGWVVGHEQEQRYFLLSELEDVQNFGIPIERDSAFTPCRLSAVCRVKGDR
jgi:hypothetical protein